MVNTEIKKAVGVIQRELTKYGLMTPGQGIDFPVSIMVEQMPNDRGRVVPHMVAKWRETTATPNGYDEMPTSNCEEMNRYFCPELFAKGITQRAEWIKADHSDCVEYLNENPFGHPALFKVWIGAQKISA